MTEWDRYIPIYFVVLFYLCEGVLIANIFLETLAISSKEAFMPQCCKTKNKKTTMDFQPVENSVVA